MLSNAKLQVLLLKLKLALFQSPVQVRCMRQGCSGLVHWDDPEGWDGEGGGRGVQDGEHMYNHG